MDDSSLQEPRPPDDTEPATPFEAIRHAEPDGREYWSARELARVLGYPHWQKFTAVVERAITACANSEHDPTEHFNRTVKVIQTGHGARQKLKDWHLSRYACYLVVQNADPAKPVVALGQTYFAVQTRRAELADAEDAGLLAGLSEEKRRLFMRHQLLEQNTRLAEAARQAGVFTPNAFALFQDHGYMGLYAGERAGDIHRRKGLTAHQRILDHMGSDELVANSFRASLARQRIEREQVTGQDRANQTHYDVGQAVREFIAEQGGAMPEDLPTPVESIQQLEAREHRRLVQEQGRQAQLEVGQQPLFGVGEAES